MKLGSDWETIVSFFLMVNALCGRRVSLMLSHSPFLFLVRLFGAVFFFFGGALKDSGT